MCVVLAVLGLLSWKMWFASYDGSVTAKVYQDGKLLYSFRLPGDGEAQEFLVENENGGKNTVRVSKEGISVSEANCPDQVCVKRGTVFYSEIPIVCMPNKLVIEFEKDGEGAGTDSGISAAGFEARSAGLRMARLNCYIAYN